MLASGHMGTCALEGSTGRPEPNGNPSRVTDFDGRRTRYQLASWNHLVAVADPLDQQSNLEYDSDENLTALVDAAGNRSVFRYDLTRRPIETQRDSRVREPLATIWAAMCKELTCDLRDGKAVRHERGWRDHTRTFLDRFVIRFYRFRGARGAGGRDHLPCSLAGGEGCPADPPANP
jgi:YD repeat-containing protein